MPPASHGIISRHGGEILALSEPGEGTRFEVRLPISDKVSHLTKSDLTQINTTGDDTDITERGEENTPEEVVSST